MGHLIGVTPQIGVRKPKARHGSCLSFQDPSEAKLEDANITTKSIIGGWIRHMTMGTRTTLASTQKNPRHPEWGICNARAASFGVSKGS